MKYEEMPLNYEDYEYESDNDYSEYMGDICCDILIDYNQMEENYGKLLNNEKIMVERDFTENYNKFCNKFIELLEKYDNLLSPKNFLTKNPNSN